MRVKIDQNTTGTHDLVYSASTLAFVRVKILNADYVMQWRYVVTNLFAVMVGCQESP